MFQQARPFEPRILGIPIQLLSIALAIAAPTCAFTTELATEEEPVVDSASLVQPALLSGPGFSVDTRVELRGYMAHFMLDTPVGPLAADSVDMLAEREAELPALDVLDKATRSDAFLGAAGRRLADTGRMMENIVLHPIDTVLGIPAGVARYFGNRLKKIGTQAQALSDRTGRTLGSSGNPYPSGDGPMTDARDDGSTHAPKAKKHWYSRIGKELEREAKRRLKYNQAKRELAERLGIDPYNGNPYIQARLSSLAWVASGGNFSAGTALGTVGGAAATVLGQSGRINDVVWKLSPDDLRERNATRLLAHCSDDLLVRQFLRRGAFSPTLQTALADVLDTLKPASGCNALLELGITAKSELEARFVVNALRMVVAHLGDRSIGGAALSIGAGLGYRALDGELVLPLPVDRLSWTNEVRTFVDRRDFSAPTKTVLIGGNASLQARRGLAERGWSIVTRFPWPGSPPYARSGEPSPVDLGE
ncbi:MAG: hypothetical protein ABIR62_01140 [Dokdonella sp.]|uniref:hypothetical protein n=1 Tax=Dokdonella sp. TaxID=2291710 RepID=UPI00326636A2